MDYHEAPVSPLEKSSLGLQPLEVIEGFKFSEDFNEFKRPFATKEESLGFLTGSESTTLCSNKDPIYSRSFVQCGAVLARNRRSGLITLIHQSMWSTSADVAVALQRSDDLDVVTVSGPFGWMPFNKPKYAYEKNPKEAIESYKSINHEDPHLYYGFSKQEKERTQIFGDHSLIKGLTAGEISKMMEIQVNTGKTGKIRQIGEISLPVSKAEGNRWYLLYRPNENVIRIYESGAKKLFKYQGFSK